MKKILLLLIAVYATVAVSAQITDTIVSLTPTNRNVLLEEFTGSNCVWCPDGHRMANELEAANPGRVNVINIYQGPYAASLFTTQFGNELASQSNLYGYPSATINRHIFSGSITSLERFDWADCANQIMSMTSPVNIAAEGTLDWTTRTVNIRVQIYYTSDQTATSNALNIAIIQDNVLGPQAGGSTYDPDQMVGDQYSHQHILRHLITGQWGETINTISQGTLIERTYEYEIPEQLGSPNPVDAFLEDLHFIAFVCEGHQEVLTNIEIPIQHVNVPAIDGYILSVNNMENYECDGHGNAYFVFRNNGTTPATFLTYTFSVNDSAIQTAEWTGNIPFLDTDTILIPTFDLNKKKDNTLTVHVTTINSENVSINPKSQTISKSVYSGGGRMIFKLETDSYASETSFIFVDPNGDTVLSGGPWPNGKHVLAFNFLPETIGCYRLEVSDSYGDGINNGYGAGNFQLLAENGSQILFDNGKFTNKVTYVIDVTTPATVTDDINVVYVTPTGSGTLSGDSWANATPSVSFALTKAMVNHADVWIAAGTYYGDTTSSNAFTMMDGVNVYGGFAGDEPEDYDLSLRDFETNATILDGQHARRVLYQPTAFNVQTIWDGFTIQNGYNTSGAIGYGGGVSMSNNGGLSHCIIQHNYAYFGGGVNASNSTISNCLISNNTASTGGGTYINNNTTIVNSSIVRNSSDYDATGIYSGDGSCSLINSIVWGNGTSANDNIAGDITCSYSAIEGGYEGEHLIILTELDPPLFVNPSQTSGIDDNTENVDWHLQEGSPCINRGNNTAVTDMLDLDGTARIKRDTVDMGCYESDYYSSPLNQPEYSNIIYVTQNGSGTQTGEDWDNATSSVSFALGMAQMYHADVWVAAGTYYGDTTADNAFTMVGGVNVYGGFAGNEPADYDLSLRDFDANATILDGQHARRVLYQPNTFFNTLTTWDGFTIQNGQTYGDGGGACLRNNGKLSQCIIQNNSGGEDCYYCEGGGVYAGYGSMVFNCRISKNTAASGGGIYAYNSTISDCLIANNTSISWQGGGGIFAEGSTISNTTIVRNNSAIYANEAGISSYDGASTLVNCIIWGNGTTASDNISGNPTCTYSAIEGGHEGEHNIMLNDELNLNPMFVNPSLTAGASDSTENVDWHLQPGSPCINRGNNAVVTDSLDLDGTARIKRDTVDMGCYESDYYSVPLDFPDYTNIIYVTQEGSGTQTGEDWNNATSSISYALSVAQMYHANVWVAAGTYYGDTSATAENAFTMIGGVNVYGGFAGNEPTDYDLSLRDFETNATILDGQNMRRVLYQPSSFNTLTTWNGFTIQHGQRNYQNGGGAYLLENGKLSQCAIQYNTASSGGGISAGYNSTVSSCLISNNRSSSQGGGVITSGATIYNSTIVRNTAYYSGGIYGEGSFSTLTNSIVWGNESNITKNIAGNITCSYSAIEGDFDGDHNILLSDAINQNPLFVSPSLTAGASDSTSDVDWHLQQGSPCINQGNNAAVIDSLDLDGAMRIKRDTVDLGCYESDFYSVPVIHPEYSNIIYVKQNGSGTRTGENWSNAAASISFAMDIAQSHNADVWVAAGIYYGDTTATAENAFTMVNGVNVYGGFAGNEPENYDLLLRDFETNTTILDGQNMRRVLYQSNGSTQTTWNGFTIQNGHTTGQGGGVNLRNYGSLSTCVIRNNYAIGTGGGIYAYYCTVTNCQISNNTSEYSGGGMYAGYNTIVSNCLISNNTANSGGGIIASNASIYNCLISNNTATSYYGNGGGVYASYNTAITNTTIVRNIATDGAGIYGGYYSTSLVNSIVWGNGTNTSDNITGDVVCSYSAIEGGYEGESIVELDNLCNRPLFVNPSSIIGVSDAISNTDWHLQQGSVCVNRGNNSLVTENIDLDGSTRIKRDTVDLGCFESDFYGSQSNSLPAVTTQQVTEITSTTALCGGTVTTDCGSTILTCGICWSTTPSPTLSDYHTVDGNSIGSFTSTLDGLSENTTYYVRAYATNAWGTFYSEEREFTTTASQGIIYVTQNGAGTHSGDSWANATSSIDTAQWLALENNAQIWVAAGIYYGNTETTDDAFYGFGGVNVYGGFAGTEPADFDLSQRDFEANTTILDGQNVRRVLYCAGYSDYDADYDSVYEYRTLWDGFTIQNGYSDGYNQGGGVYLDLGVLSNCIVQYNSAQSTGGVYAGYHSTVSNCQISNNTSEEYGGGGMSAYEATVSNCLISNNTSVAEGGGVSMENSTVTCCQITDNSSDYIGGGIYALNSTISNSLIANNSADNSAAGGVFANNTNIISTTIVRNSAYYDAGVSGNCDLVNSIVWGNGTDMYNNISYYGVNCSYSAIEGWYNDGEGIIHLGEYYGEYTSPLFVNPSSTVGASDATSNVDWHLQQGSPCVNSGNNAAVTESLDLDGTARIKRDTVDLGCYEWSRPIVYVTVTGAGTHSGDSWANATSSIDTAQNLAQAINAEVWVASGTYYGDIASNNAFVMHDGVNVYGGFAGNEPVGYNLSLRDFEANETILDGDSTRRVLFQPHEFSTRTTWDGFTIQNGNTNYYYEQSYDGDDGFGGGAYLTENGVLSHCVVKNNVGVLGGGIFAQNNSNISYCLISDNMTYNSGGGVCIGLNAMLSRSLIQNNDAYDGGGVYVYESTVLDCQIIHNNAETGGGVSASSSIISNCLISNNDGSGVSVDASTVSNSTIVRNTASSGSGILSFGNNSLINCIVWGNGTTASEIISGNLTCFYSAIEGGYEGNNNITLSELNPPLFVNPSLTAGASDSTENVDWHLLQGSPCINSGNNAAVNDSLDLDGTARIKHGTVDLGCYESDYGGSEPCLDVVYEFSHTACNSYEWNGQTYPQSGEYEQTFALENGCDSVVTLHLTITLADSADFAETACDSYEWNGETFTSSGDYTRTFTNANDCDSVVTLHLTVNYSNAGDTTAVACDSFDWYEHASLTQSGEYVHTFTDAAGCDSVVTLHLTVTNSNTGDTTAIARDSFDWYEHTNLTQSGDYMHTFTNVDGCDSIVTLQLTVNYSNTGDTTAIVCDSFDWYEHTSLMQSGEYMHTFTNAAGCDSVVTLHLTVNLPTTGTDVQTACDSFTWIDGVTYTESNSTAIYTLSNASGCDSIVTLNLTINHGTHNVETETACESFTWHGATYTTSGTYTYEYTNASGCASVDTLHLTVNYGTHNVETETACESFTWHGATYTTSGTYTYEYTNASGCASVDTLYLTVNYSTHNIETETACESFTWHGVTYTTSGTYTYEYTNASGCTSADTLKLTVNQPVTELVEATACDSYEWSGTTYTETGDYTQTFIAANGCDSVVTLHLTINPSVTEEIEVSTTDSCYTWNSQSYCTSGDYTQTLQTVHGCDSIVTLHLTITVGIEDHNLGASMTVYPNPTNDIVNVQITNHNSPITQIHVFDAYGKLVDVVETRCTTSLQTAQIDLSRYAPGVYFVKAVADDKVVAVRKVVKR